MKCGNSIRNLRLSIGFSQKEFAEKVGLSIASVQGYEQGKFEPKKETIKKIADTIGVKFGFNINGELYFYESDMLTQATKFSALQNMLNVLGYEFIDGSYYDAPPDEIGLIHLKKENIDIHINDQELDLLENAIYNNIDLEIYRLRKKKNI